jgi:hypothetical protein
MVLSSSFSSIRPRPVGSQIPFVFGMHEPYRQSAEEVTTAKVSPGCQGLGDLVSIVAGRAGFVSIGFQLATHVPHRFAADPGRVQTISHGAVLIASGIVHRPTLWLP